MRQPRSSRAKALSFLRVEEKVQPSVRSRCADQSALRTRGLRQTPAILSFEAMMHGEPARATTSHPPPTGPIKVAARLTRRRPMARRPSFYRLTLLSFAPHLGRAALNRARVIP
jgi:hypothetical protein